MAAMLLVACGKKDGDAAANPGAEKKAATKKAEEKPAEKKAEEKPAEEANKTPEKPATAADKAVAAVVKEGEKVAGKAVEAAAPVADGLEAFLKDEKAALTPAIYEMLLLGLKDCKLKGSGIDKGCAGYKTLKKARGRKTALKDLAGASKGIGAKHIGHASPAVRLQSAQMMASVFGSDDSTQSIIGKAARVEKNPVVLRAMLRTIGSRHMKTPELKQLFMDMADHADEGVRTEVVIWFLSSFSKGVDDTYAKAITMLDGDASMKLRAMACEKLYGSHNPKAIDHLKKYLKAADTDDKLYTGCFKGAVKTWTGYPKPETPLKAGYELTLEILKATPRTENRPPWNGINGLGASTFKTKNSFDEKWVAAVKDWYKVADLAAALADVAKDRNAKWMARTGAIKAILEIGGDQSVIQGIKDSYNDVAGKFGDDSHVIKAADKALGVLGK
jgi:hypothetical protein